MGVINTVKVTEERTVANGPSDIEVVEERF